MNDNFLKHFLCPEKSRFSTYHIGGVFIRFDDDII